MKIVEFNNSLFHKCFDDSYHNYYSLYKDNFVCYLCATVVPGLLGLPYAHGKSIFRVGGQDGCKALGAPQTYWDNAMEEMRCVFEHLESLESLL